MNFITIGLTLVLCMLNLASVWCIIQSLFLFSAHTLSESASRLCLGHINIEKKIVNASAAVRSNCEFIKYNWKGHLCLFTFFCFNTHILSSCYLEVWITLCIYKCSYYYIMINVVCNTYLNGLTSMCSSLWITEL